jgi:hypothetical protein
MTEPEKVKFFENEMRRYRANELSMLKRINQNLRDSLFALYGYYKPVNRIHDEN